MIFQNIRNYLPNNTASHPSMLVPFPCSENKVTLYLCFSVLELRGQN
jgi:hypothetical protein